MLFFLNSDSSMASPHSIVRISAKPVTSKISEMISFTWRSVMEPCRLIVFCAASSTRSPAEER